jgi:hypothetical protein
MSVTKLGCCRTCGIVLQHCSVDQHWQLCDVRRTAGIIIAIDMWNMAHFLPSLRRARFASRPSASFSPPAPSLPCIITSSVLVVAICSTNCISISGQHQCKTTCSQATCCTDGICIQSIKLILKRSAAVQASSQIAWSPEDFLLERFQLQCSMSKSENADTMRI